MEKLSTSERIALMKAVQAIQTSRCDELQVALDKVSLAINTVNADSELFEKLDKAAVCLSDAHYCAILEQREVSGQLAELEATATYCPA